MVIAEKMKEPVDCEPLELFIQGDALLYCLSFSSLEIDNDITKNKVRSSEFGARSAELLRERENICGFIYSPESAVKQFYCPVIHKEDAEFSFLETEEMECLP